MELRADGHSYSEIRKQLGISKQTCVNWNRQLSDQISGLRAVRVQEVTESWLMAKERRLELFAEQISRLRDALDGRDLAEIPTGELLRLYLRYLDSVSRILDGLKVDMSVSDPLATYRDILIQCLELPEGMTADDIPRLSQALSDQWKWKSE